FLRHKRTEWANYRSHVTPYENPSFNSIQKYLQHFLSY
ncbi:glutamine synthetase, partial [Mycobacterium tuberculosis]